MSTETESTKSKIKPEIASLTERLMAEITLDKKTGVAAVPAETYAKLMPEGLTMDMAEKVYAYEDQLIAAGANALGRVSIPVMKKATDLDRSTLAINTVGKSHLGFAFDRARNVPTRNEDGTTGTREKFGAITVDRVTYGSKNRGQLAAVKNELADLALASFGKK